MLYILAFNLWFLVILFFSCVCSDWYCGDKAFDELKSHELYTENVLLKMTTVVSLDVCTSRNEVNTLKLNLNVEWYPKMDFV